VLEEELAVIVWGIKHFRPYLYGRKFKIISDHKPLMWIMSVKDPGSRLLRWRSQKNKIMRLFISWERRMGTLTRYPE
jgi:hypothetical protein